MKQSILNEINSLFETGEIQTIKFSKTGKTTVKYVKEPKLIQYSKCDNILQVIKEHAELSKILEKLEMKPKLKLTVDEFVKTNTIDQDFKNQLEKCVSDMEFAKKSMDKAFARMLEPKKTLFERFYDTVGNWLGGGKSFAPDECKSFA